MTPRRKFKNSSKSVRVTLSGETAEVLATLLNHIGGCPDPSHPRHETDKLATVLERYKSSSKYAVSGSLYIERADGAGC